MRLAYACINKTLAKQNVTVNRTARLATIEKNGAEFIKQLVMENLQDLQKILEWNEAAGIRFYRMSSDMISHVSNEKLSKEILEAYTLDFAREKLAAVGKYAREHGHRLTFHVGQYTLLSSPDNDVKRRSIRDLEIHADILDAMGMKPVHGSVIVLHGGGTYQNKLETINRIKQTIESLPQGVREKICLENDERSYSPEDLLPICEEYNIPFCLDVFHYKVMYPEKYNEILADTKLWDRVALTWTRRGIKQKIHISSQRPEGKPGAHADYIDAGEINLRTVLCLCKKYNSDAVIEAKKKEKAVMKILNEYFDRIDSGDRVEWYMKGICG